MSKTLTFTKFKSQYPDLAAQVEDEFDPEDDMEVELSSLARLQIKGTDASPLYASPAMSDDNQFSCNTLFTVNLEEIQTIAHNMGNPTCEVMIYKKAAPGRAVLVSVVNNYLAVAIDES